MALVVEVKEGGVWGAAVKGAILRCMCIHRSGTNEVKVLRIFLTIAFCQDDSSIVFHMSFLLLTSLRNQTT